MLFEARCPRCQTTFQANSFYAGSKRVCASCNSTFTLEVPTAVTATVKEKFRAKNQPPPEVKRQSKRLSCASCSLTGQVMLAQSDLQVRCQYCGHSLNVVEAEQLALRFDQAEETLWVMLLGGKHPVDAISAMISLGLAEAAAQSLYSKRRDELPFVRFHAAQRPDADRFMRPAQVCDCCAGAMRIAPRALFVIWSRVESSSKSLSPWTALTMFGGVAIFETQQSVSERRAIYFACDACSGQLTSLFGGYAGYPATVGYRVASTRRLG